MASPATPRSTEPAAEVDPQLLAAFRLGHRSRTLRLWQTVFWEQPEWEDTEIGVPLALQQLEEARLKLANKINQGVLPEMRRVIVEIDRETRAILAAWDRTGRYRSREFGSHPVPGRGSWEAFCVLTDQALPDGSLLQRLCAFGAALGDCELLLRNLPAGAPLPDLGPVVRRVLALQCDAARLPPLIGEMARLAPRLSELGACGFLEQVLGTDRKLWVGFEHIYMDNGISRLSHVIEKHLGKGVRPTSGPPAAEAPEASSSDQRGPGEQDEGKPPQPPPKAYHFDIVIDPKHRRAVRGEATVEFGGREQAWKVAELLIRNAPGLVANDDLRRSVWSDGTKVIHVEDATFHSTVSHARSRLERLGVTIANVKNLGYRLIEHTPAPD
jgi:hypothetical protein